MIDPQDTNIPTSPSVIQMARGHIGRADDCGRLAIAVVAEIENMDDMVFAIRGMLAGYAGQPSRAGDAFKVVDAAASAIEARQRPDHEDGLDPKAATARVRRTSPNE